MRCYGVNDFDRAVGSGFHRVEVRSLGIARCRTARPVDTGVALRLLPALLELVNSTLAKGSMLLSLVAGPGGT